MPTEQVLNEEQQAAAEHKEGPMLIIAGAGSGKTTTLIHRVANLVKDNVVPERILVLTFTNKAADELTKRAAEQFDKRCGRIEASTYHSFCAKRLREYTIYTDYDEDFTIITPNETVQAIGMIKSQNGINTKDLKNFPKDNKIAQIISYAVNKEISIEEALSSGDNGKWDKFMRYREMIESIQNLYTIYKIEKNIMDFDDLLLVFYRLLESNEKVRKAIEEQYDYIMVDEYQDTNKLQEKIIFSIRRDNKNLVVVGDDAQSIYSFRGADITNIISFPEKMDPCKVVNIRTNYRSANQIVDFSNDIINVNATIGSHKDMMGTWESSADPYAKHVKDETEEAEFVVKAIKCWINKGKDPSEFAVLARTSNEFNELETLLTKEGIEYVKYGGKKFFDRECIQDILAYLRQIENPKDQLALYRLLKLLPGIGDQYAGMIVEHTGGNINPDYFNRYKFHKELEAFAGFLQKIKEKSYQETLEAVIENYLAIREQNALGMQNKKQETIDQDLEEIEKDKEVINTLKQISEKYSCMKDFLDAITLDAETVKQTEEDGNPIVLSTIHSIKGLEYETVIVLNCVDNKFPTTDDKTRGTEQDNEELRCFYVAATRAKEYLILMVPKRVWLFGKYINVKPSHYIRAIFGV